MDLEPVNNVLQEYNQYYSIRLNKRCCGGAIYVKKNHTCSILKRVTVNESYIESVFFFKVVHLNKQAVVGSIYRPPNTDFHSLIYIFFNLPSVISVSSDTIICGDFDIDLLKINISNDMASSFIVQ